MRGRWWIAACFGVLIALFFAGAAQAVHDQQFQLDGDVSATTTTSIGGTTQAMDWSSFFDANVNRIPGAISPTGPFTNSDFQRDFFAVESGNRELVAERRLGDVDRHLQQQVVTLALEKPVGLDVQDDI